MNGESWEGFILEGTRFGKVMRGGGLEEKQGFPAEIIVESWVIKDFSGLEQYPW